VNKIIWEMIVDVITLVLSLVVIWFAFGIQQRLSGRLATAGIWGILAMIVFSIHNVAILLESSGIVSIQHLERITHTTFIVFLVIASWNILKSIREVNGEAISDYRIKIRKSY